MGSREERILRIEKALPKADLATLEAIEDLLARKRVLKRTRSEAEAAVKEGAVGKSTRTLQRQQKGLQAEVFRVDPKKTGAIYILKRWTALENGRDYHPRLFLLAMIIRCVFDAVRGLRAACAATRDKVWRLQINGERFERSCLFRKLDTTKHVNTTFFDILVHSMARMHCHSVLPTKDSFHKKVAPVLTLKVQLQAKVRRLLFFFEFTFLLHFVTDVDQLERCFLMEPQHFAMWCFKSKIIPICNRYGQGRGAKTAWARLMKSAHAQDQVQFVKIIAEHHTRVPSTDQCREVAAILTGGDNRVQKLCSFLQEQDNAHYGDFAQKNYIECFVAQRLLLPTEAELAAWPDGDGSKTYYQGIGWTRPEFIPEVRRLYGAIESVDIIRDGVTRSVKMPFKASDITEALGQYWGCAQQRTLRATELVSKGAATPVRKNLLPNEDLMQLMTAVWEQQGDADSLSEGSDSGAD